MKVAQAWQEASAKLASEGVEDALLEAELLLRQALNVERACPDCSWPNGKLVERADFYGGLGGELTNSQRNELNKLLERRLGHEPSAYIRGSREFYRLEFYVDERVLIPRPETELLVEKALEVARATLSLSKGQGGGNTPLLIADIGTGSGAIAIALAVNLPHSKIYAVDSSVQALEVAEINRKKHGVAGRIQLLLGDLLAPLPQTVDIIVANLPYIPDNELLKLAPEVSRYEPRLALVGGVDGLDYISRLVVRAPAMLEFGGALLVEVGIGQAEKVAAIASMYFPQVAMAADLAGIPRVVVGMG